MFTAQERGRNPDGAGPGFVEIPTKCKNNTLHMAKSPSYIAMEKANFAICVRF